MPNSEAWQKNEEGVDEIPGHLPDENPIHSPDKFISVANIILQQVVDIILKIIPTDKIILLGYINKDNEPFSIFNNNCYVVTDPKRLNLLVVGQINSTMREEILDKVEAKCEQVIPATIMLFTTSEFNALNSHRNQFAEAILQCNQALYESLRTVRNRPKEINPIISIQPNPSELFGWYKRGLNFWQTAHLQHHIGELGMAAFCLHQTAEQLLVMLVLATIGFRSGTHNPEKLLRLLRFHKKEVNCIFYPRTPEEKERLELLKKSYIHYRYRSDFVITASDIDYFMKEISKLIRLANKVIYSKTNTTCLETALA